MAWPIAIKADSDSDADATLLPSQGPFSLLIGASSSKNDRLSKWGIKLNILCNVFIRVDSHSLHPRLNN